MLESGIWQLGGCSALYLRSGGLEISLALSKESSIQDIPSASLSRLKVLWAKLFPGKKLVSQKKNFDISESGLVVSRKQEEQHCPNPERSWVHFSAEFPKETWNEPPCLCIPTIPEACLAFTRRCVRLSHSQSPKPFLGVSCATPSLSLHGNTKSCSHKEPPEMSQPQTTTRACICSGKQENPSPSCNSTAAGAPQAPPQQTPQFSPKLCPATSGVHFQTSIPLLQGPFSALSPSARAGGRL